MSANRRFDLAVVGAGPGDYVAAIRAAQLGCRVALVEAEGLGGVCLHWGCIPSKALLSGAELVEAVRRRGRDFGVEAGVLTLDYARAVEHSRRTVEGLARGVRALLRANRIECIRSVARLASPTALELRGDGVEVIEADHLLLATGSRDAVPPGVAVDGAQVLTSREALVAQDVPQRLVVLGAGAVGLELAYVNAMYGAQVTLVEQAGQVLPGADAEAAAVLQRELRAKGIRLHLRTRFEELKVKGQEVRVQLTREGETEELRADRALVALGRRARSEELGLEEAGITPDPRGFVPVDANGRTAAPTVSAIGDLTGGPMLAHKASAQGVAVAELLAGMPGAPLNPLRIPTCIYTQPQVAWIGHSESEAAQVYGGDAIGVGRFPFKASGRALAALQPAGFAKVIVHRERGEILGAHVVGHGASELVGELALAIALEATSADLASTCHAHPTLSESIREAVMVAEGRPLHF